MKRCPQCEFIYEDEQITCDMDGTSLAFDASVAADNTPSRSRLKWFALPAVLGTMLAALLFVAFYASPLMFASPEEHGQPAKAQTSPTSNAPPEPAQTKPANDQPSSLPSPDVSDESAAEPVVMATDDREPARKNHPNLRAPDSRLTIRRGVPPLPRVPSLPRLPPARMGTPPNSTQHRSEQRAHGDPKRPSKIESFLKKTGRIIKKPFKF